MPAKKRFHYGFCIEGNHTEFNNLVKGQPGGPSYLRELAKRYGEMGYDAVESVGVLLRSGGTTAEYKAAMDQEGMMFTGLHWLLAKISGVHLTDPNPAIMERTQAEIIALANMTAELGGNVMVHGSPAQRTLPRHSIGQRRAFEVAAENYQKVMRVIGGLPVVVAFEQLAPSETDFMTSMEDVRELITAVNHPHFQAVLDTKALYSKCGSAEGVADAIREYADVGVHFHANDPESPDGLIGGPGLSTFDFTPIFEALKEVAWHEVHPLLGRQRQISVECFDFQSPNRPLDVTARRSIEYMREIERQVFA